MVYHKVRAGLDNNDKIVAWDHHIVAQQLTEGTAFEALAVRAGIVAQMEGGIGYALGTELRDKITLIDGEVEQSNFND
jgi:hypothetical protein